MQYWIPCDKPDGGTALGVIRELHSRGRIKEVFADETRPLLQGARLTAWELEQEGIPFRLLPDGRGSNGNLGWSS
ncbi:MAG: hypothetical protein WDO06_00675 [Actinomycetota bacterium]